MTDYITEELEKRQVGGAGYVISQEIMRKLDEIIQYQKEEYLGERTTTSYVRQDYLKVTKYSSQIMWAIDYN